jgi:aryl-alcohol dehydrogenase-like predicted oxidoreductase
MVSKIILGTVQFGLNYGINNKSGKPESETVFSILDLAFKNDIRLLDTAEAYGNAHEVIGAYHRKSMNRFEVITKFHAGRKELSESLNKRVEQNLKILGVSSLYSYMFHSFADFIKYFEHYKSEIELLKKEGLIKKLGVSVYTNNEIEELLNYAEVGLIQLPFNLLDNNRQREQILQKAKKRGIEIHTRSTYLQGLFFMKEHIPGKLLPLKPYLSEINEIVQKKSIDINTLSLGYSVKQKNIDGVLIGVDSVEHLRENLESLGSPLSDDVAELVDSINVKDTRLLNPSNWK